MRKSNWAIPAIVMLAANAPAAAVASEMVYHPVTPTFGGNPLNGSALLSTAQAQGEGVKSGSQGPDLSGLNNALNNLGSGAVIVGGSGGGGAGGGSSSAMSNSVRATVP
jgi:curli production assembly/transport component CsgF